MNAEGDLGCGCIALRLTHITGLHAMAFYIGSHLCLMQNQIGYDLTRITPNELGVNRIFELTHKLTDHSHPPVILLLLHDGIL